MSLGTARIVIILALIVAGVAVLANGFGSASSVRLASRAGGGASGTSPGSSPSQPPSQAPSPVPSPQTRGVKVAVFNGTFTPGLAGQVLATLTGAGYLQAQPPGDAPAKVVATTVVYFRGGSNVAQNRVDAKYMARKYFAGAHVAILSADLSGLVSKSTQVAIVIGSDYTPPP
ncbi:MAG: LytR C-terminal domain-containing protein [Actinomycetota bacterium]